MSATSDQTRAKLLLMTPCFGGQVTTLFAGSLLRLQAACLARGLPFDWRLHGGDALITRARAELMTSFLDETDATHLLFVDADIGFAPEQVFRLLEFGADVAAAAYPTKRFNWPVLTRLLRDGHPAAEAASFNYVLGVENTAAVAVRDGFASVRYAGTGFLMLRRSALLTLCAAHPELRYRGVQAAEDRLKDSPHRVALFDCMIDPDSGAYLSEDFAFCRRWTALGGEIWLDVRSRLSHAGGYTFEGDLAMQLRPNEPED